MTSPSETELITVASPANLPETIEDAKEHRLVEYVKKELEVGRWVAVYAGHTGAHDVAPAFG